MGTIPLDVGGKDWVAEVKRETLMLIKRGVPLDKALIEALKNISGRGDNKNADKDRR